ncbi:oligosaccharide flippase family protein [Chryseobacterium taklimakanense]|uniref:oligosaccharide flippase family protein n=1 Tax=Chryseobacterium taklimakanense TaxID=536441 RepID=UPI0013DE0985|nr:oligosaccharide flippase family protein [Chryseobacterium taklimakanense]
MKKNIIANVFGRLWGLISSFLFIPLYIKFLGFESYSVISFTLMIAGIMAVLDGGLTATLSREFARTDNTDDEKLRIYRTLETVYFAVVLISMALVVVFSGLIANSLNVKSFSHDQLAKFLKIVSVDIGFQLLLRFYMGGLLGLEKQVKANAYQILWGIVRNAVAVVVIYFYPSLFYFFLWQSISTVIFTLLLKIELDKQIFHDHKFSIKPKFEKSVFREVRKFAGGMMLISIIAALNTQMDKMTISKLLSIESLGYYTLAVSLATALIVVVNPIATAILPKFTSLYSGKSYEEAKELFNTYNVVSSILIFSILAIFIFFSKDLLWLWTGNLKLAENAYKIVPIISIAYALIAMQVIPYHVAIANGYTRLNNILGISSIALTVPGYIYGIKNYGVFGAAVVFMVMQLITLLIYIYFINKKFIGELFIKSIFIKQILLPLFSALLTAFSLSILFKDIGNDNRISLFTIIAFSSLITLAITMLVNLPKKFSAQVKNMAEKIIRR